MKFRKIIGKVHLLLGLSTGVVVLIIGLTGAIYCFAPELENLQSYRHVESSDQPFLPPSQIQQIAERQIKGKTPQRIYYYSRQKAVMVLFNKKDEYSYSVFIDPFRGEVLKVRDNGRDFLSVVLQIHRTLYIPYGHEIIRWSTVIFILMLISGLVLWWPRKRITARRSLRIMWKASPKRLNYDLHKVLGFYITWIAIFTSLTGLMFAFPGFANLTYQITGSANSKIQSKPPLSKEVKLDSGSKPIDMVWSEVYSKFHAEYQSIMLVLPTGNDGSILVRANPERKTLYKTDFIYFDQYTGKEISGAYVWGRYKDRSVAADDIRRMNYDIHTGAILGLAGRTILFLVALIVASLPITGFYFWWGRTFKRRY